jgi:diguanylate cyclase (GGDEF)-like protein
MVQSEITIGREGKTTKHGHSAAYQSIRSSCAALEAHMFSHGYAYRYGGDEYVALIPNMEADLAATFFKGLASRLKNLEYGHIKEKTTVSIGLYSVPGDTIYTEKEIEFRANKAKNEAKKKGKNCIVIYREADDGQEILEKVE